MQKTLKNVINDSEVISDRLANKTDIEIDSKFCKISCRECKQNCYFRLSQINDDMPVTQVEINTELKRHGHPLSRKRNGKNRTLAGAKLELKGHYLRHHFQTFD